jgi:hypothetical protein
MTMPDERTRAVIYAKSFLQRLASPYAGGIKGIRRDIREEARRILRHYPAWFDLGRADAFDAQAAMRYGEEETQADWLRETTPHTVAKSVTKRQVRARKVPK